MLRSERGRERVAGWEAGSTLGGYRRYLAGGEWAARRGRGPGQERKQRPFMRAVIIPDHTMTLEQGAVYTLHHRPVYKSLIMLERLPW